ncbi:MAG TPA: hypothetical protein DCY79_05455 [Planctomycetaceae bacterium]|nr:hypothetical protein [Blastopirellula sp.]HAY79236.1 hypothetical protein [Planctomycetaceae bacterium]
MDNLGARNGCSGANVKSAIVWRAFCELKTVLGRIASEPYFVWGAAPIMISRYAVSRAYLRLAIRFL